jgi:hypothetical protein
VITNLAEVRQAHADFLREHERMVRGVARRASKAAHHHATQKNHGFKHRTGAAKRGVRNLVVPLRGGVRVVLKNAVPHASYLEYGTDPHYIHARRAKFLVFYWPKVGRTVFYKRVLHPGTRPYHWIEWSVGAAFRDAKGMLSRGMTSVAARF